ncbi:MAG: type II secretion system F family protein [Lachnospiraceae bacterium]
MGLEYLVGFTIPTDLFIAICVLWGTLCSLMTLTVFHQSPVVVILAALIGLWIPVMILVISNEADNDAMLMDIKNIFELLKIQLHAGVYVVEALENCYEDIRNKRLKSAIKNLLNDIYLSKNMTKALDEFGAHFNNHHIDTLVIILKQSVESGYSVQNLDNAFEEVLDVERAINIKIENSVERNVQILQVLFMAAIIAISIYCSVVELKGLFQIV